jgi:hypothetical protein
MAIPFGVRAEGSVAQRQFAGNACQAVLYLMTSALLG